MWVDNGGFFDGPFAHYEATPDAIEASAVELDRSYGSVEALSSDVDAAHRPALAGLAGDLAGPMAAAPQPVRANGRQVMGAAMVAAGSVRVFGHAVQDFNAGVDASTPSGTMRSRAISGSRRRRTPPTRRPSRRPGSTRCAPTPCSTRRSLC